MSGSGRGDSPCVPWKWGTRWGSLRLGAGEGREEGRKGSVSQRQPRESRLGIPAPTHVREQPGGERRWAPSGVPGDSAVRAGAGRRGTGAKVSTPAPTAPPSGPAYGGLCACVHPYFTRTYRLLVPERSKLREGKWHGPVTTESGLCVPPQAALCAWGAPAKPPPILLSRLDYMGLACQERGQRPHDREQLSPATGCVPRSQGPEPANAHGPDWVPQCPHGGPELTFPPPLSPQH